MTRFLLLAACLLTATARAQTAVDSTASVPVPQQFTSFEKPLIFADTLASDKREKKKKRFKRKVYYGHKTRKRYTKKQRGSRLTLELFYTLKETETPDAYLASIKEVYWYDTKKRKIVKGSVPKKRPDTYELLHGPYEKRLNGDLIEEGIFYAGVKHGRWERYATDDDQTLMLKEKYRRGWPKNAKITYYDSQRQKVKEVIPYTRDGYTRNGTYYQFYENGHIQTRGQFDRGQRVGKWLEFYDFGFRRHKEVQYPENASDDPAEPYLLKEYDRHSRLVYDKEEEDKKKARAGR